MIIYGLHPVLEALRTGRVSRVRVADRRDERVAEVLQAAAERGVPVEQVPREVLAHASGRGAHQGVVAEVAGGRDWRVEELVRDAAGVPLLVVLDGIEDPHNVGAILRTADAAGASGVVRQARRAAPLDGAVARASAGAVAHVRIATVVNIARAIDELKRLGVWIVGLAASGRTRYDEVEYGAPTAVVLGAEGTGLRRLVREACDWAVSIPMAGRVESLNVSVAAGIVLFEAVRQRRAAAGLARGGSLDTPRAGRLAGEGTN
jgi:23S rRNA (guanosine2251-2'-O)-methyltransferase